MPDWTTDVNLVTKMFALKNFLNEMFPKKVYNNIAAKYAVIKKNIYTNDWLYSILNEARNQTDHDMYKAYFNLKYE